MARDQTSDHRTITLEKFAKRVASAVGRFFDVSLPPSFWNFCFFGSRSVVVLTAYISIGRRKPRNFKRKIQTGG